MILTQEQRQVFYRNIVKFVVGIILLSISYNYIQNHPAEKASIMSGFEVMYERGQLFLYETIGRDTSVIRQKQRIDHYYQELIKLAEDRECVPAELLTNIYETYNAFLHNTHNEFSNLSQYYVNRSIEFENSINEHCR